MTATVTATRTVFNDIVTIVKHTPKAKNDVKSTFFIALMCVLTWVKYPYFGGDGGNRNRVRKSIPANFYERSLSFKIPLKKRRQTGFPLRYPLGHDELQGYSFIHVHC